MTNQITQKFIDLLGPITDDKLHFGKYAQDPTTGGYNVTALTDEQRQKVEQLVIDHYKVKKVLWMGIPSGLTEDGTQAIVAQTHKLLDTDILYEGKTAYVYQIMFSPIMYDPKTVYEPVKDGCTFSPLLFNPENFTPSRRIVLSFNPEIAMDKARTAEDIRLDLHLQLDKILDNPDDYMPQGFRACMLRFAAK
jgi:hypothetical protein